MRYWDSSAIVPLLVSERQTAAVGRELAADPLLLVWWGTPVEIVSALARRERDGALSADDVSQALDRLAVLELAWNEIQPSDRLRAHATRLLRVHPLRAADSLQLAAAVAAAEAEPRSLPLVTLDERLALAARREGFPVVSV